MADETIKKVVIARNSFPALPEGGEYIVRYRIISEDRNRTSHWSPQFFVEPDPIVVVDDEGITVTQTGTFLTVVWDDTDYNGLYDVFIAWGSSAGSVGDTEFFTSVSGRFVTIPVRTSETTEAVRVFIQRVTQPKRIEPSLSVATSSVINLS